MISVVGITAVGLKGINTGPTGSTKSSIAAVTEPVAPDPGAVTAVVAQDTSEDDTAFEAAVKSGRVTAYGEYAQAWPEGVHLKEADAGAWASAQKQNSILAYQTYLKYFPKGEHVEAANSSIAKLKQAAKDKAVQEEAEKQKAAEAEAQRQEQARIEAERQEALRQEAARQEAARLEATKKEAERQKLLSIEAAKREEARQELLRLKEQERQRRLAIFSRVSSTNLCSEMLSLIEKEKKNVFQGWRKNNTLFNVPCKIDHGKAYSGKKGSMHCEWEQKSVQHTIKEYDLIVSDLRNCFPKGEVNFYGDNDNSMTLNIKKPRRSISVSYGGTRFTMWLFLYD